MEDYRSKQPLLCMTSMYYFWQRIMSSFGFFDVKMILWAPRYGAKWYQRWEVFQPSRCHHSCGAQIPRVRSTCAFGVGRIADFHHILSSKWFSKRNMLKESPLDADFGCWFTKILGRNATPKIQVWWNGPWVFTRKALNFLKRPLHGSFEPRRSLK